MNSLLLIVHLVACVVLVGVILLQAGKGASMGAMFGSGGANTLFGARGPATFFQKFTTTVALVFLLTSIGLARIAKTNRTESVIDTIPSPAVAPQPSEQGTTEAPAQPAPTTPAPSEEKSE